MRTTHTTFLMFVLLALALPCRVAAQSVGQILGTVTDPTQAVIPNVKVTARQQGTGLTWSTVTSGAGTYSLPSLPVGTYTVTAEAPGFKIGSSDVTLDVSQQREVDFTLVVVGATTKVEVSAAAALLTTTNDTLGGLVNGQQVSTLPLNGRDITNLVFLQPGVNYEINGIATFSMNGNRGGTGSSFLDGSETTHMQFGGPKMTDFNLDAIAEFKVLQNNYSADNGRGGGAIVEVVSKSGTNQLHGSAFEFVRNSDFDARNFFSTTVPPYQRNEFGVTLGGPVSIPGVYQGKGRTFFFFEYAGFRQRLGEPILMPVPTPAERGGTLPITGANGEPDQLIVPLNSVSQYVLNHYPLPNQPSGPFGANTFNFEYSVPEDHNQVSGRVDHHFSDKDTLFARYTRIDSNGPVNDPVALIEGGPSFTSGWRSAPENAALNEVHTFSPTLLNTLNLGFSYNADWTILAPVQNIAETTFTDGSLGTWGPDFSNGRYLRSQPSLRDTVNWTKGRHSMSLGFDIRRMVTNEQGASVGGYPGVYYFAPGSPLPVNVPSASGLNNLAAGTPSSSSILSFMVGAPAFYDRSLAFPGFGTQGEYPPFSLRYNRYASWFQDDVRLGRKLTLNIGLRYEYNPPPHEPNDRLTSVVDDSTFEGGTLYHQLILNPQNPTEFPPDYRGWGPRFGLAYKVTDKTVFRGGFGVFTAVIPNLYLDQQAGLSYPFAAFIPALNPTYSLAPLPYGGLPAVTDLKGNPMPPGGNTKKVPPNTPLNLAPAEAFIGGPLELNVNSMSLRNGYVLAGNATLERELPGDIVVQAAYVTNNAVHLWASEWPNAYSGAEPQYTPYSNANPGLGEFELMDNHAHSTYDSLQAMGRKVSTKYGLQFQASYTYEKAIDNATTVWNSSIPNGAMLPNNLLCYSCEKAVSGFDFPHTLVVNFVYAIPTDKWQALSAVPRRLTAGWQVSSIARAQSGYPFTVTSPYGTVQFGTDTYTGYQPTRPFLDEQPTLRTGGGPEEQFFSDAVINNQSQYLATPTVVVNGSTVQTAPGNLGRNTFRSEPFSNVDFSLIKDTKITERATIQFRGEFFNILNQHAFVQPVSVLGASGFGVSNSTVLAERQIQFALRLVF